MNDEVVNCIMKLITNPVLSELNAVSLGSELKNVQNKEWKEKYSFMSFV